MGLLAKKKRRPAPEIGNATVADISFLLLIFFIVSTVFNEELGLPLILPSGESGQAAQVSRKNVLEIKANADNTVSVKGVPTRVQDVRRIAKEAQDVNPKLIVVIQTAPQAQYGVMIDILDELKLAEIKKISIKMSED
ncbi:biopolymer transporter ExbD [bacterium]|nr:biopolymer transporter ExbD [bacterium]